MKIDLNGLILPSDSDRQFIEIVSYHKLVMLICILLDKFLADTSKTSEADTKEFIENIKYNIAQYELFLEKKKELINKFNIKD